MKTVKILFFIEINFLIHERAILFFKIQYIISAYQKLRNASHFDYSNEKCQVQLQKVFAT